MPRKYDKKDFSPQLINIALVLPEKINPEIENIIKLKNGFPKEINLFNEIAFIVASGKELDRQKPRISEIKSHIQLFIDCKKNHKPMLIDEVKCKLEILLSASKKLIEKLKDDGGKYDLLTRNIILQLAGFYYRGTSNKPTIYHSPYSKTGYGGKFYNFLLDCSRHFDINTPISLGEIGIETLIHFRAIASRLKK